MAFALAIAGMLPEEDPVQPYDVGTYDELLGRSQPGDDIALHHVPQGHPAEQVIPGFDYKTGPCIALPTPEHKLIPNIRGDFDGTAAELVERGIEDLQNYTAAPIEKIEQLRELIHQLYGI